MRPVSAEYPNTAHDSINQDFLFRKSRLRFVPSKTTVLRKVYQMCATIFVAGLRSKRNYHKPNLRVRVAWEDARFQDKVGLPIDPVSCLFSTWACLVLLHSVGKVTQRQPTCPRATVYACSGVARCDHEYNAHSNWLVIGIGTRQNKHDFANRA